MDIVEVFGDPRTIGRSTGEATREQIRKHLEMFPANRRDQGAWEKRLPAFLDTLRQYLPDVLEEMEGTAEGADIPLDQILQLNLPMYANDLVLADQKSASSTGKSMAGGFLLSLAPRSR